MNEIRQIEPEKVNGARFEAHGLRVDTSKPFDWYVIDRQGDEGPLGTEIANCGKGDPAQAQAQRIAYALNTLGRLLGDPAAPYYVEEVDRLADALLAVSGQSTTRSVEALKLGEAQVSAMFGSESRVIGAGADMLRRMLAELLKFALVGDTIREQAQAWIERAHPGLTAGTFDTITAGQYVANLLGAYTDGATAGKMKASDLGRVVETIVRDVGELGDRSSPEDWPEAMLVTGEELATIVRNALDPS